MYDLSETLEIIGKQLSNNQIKDIVAQSFNMVQQLKKIFNDCEVPFLYQIVRKMQVNQVLTTNILIERVEKNRSKQECNCKDQNLALANELSQGIINISKEVQELPKSSKIAMMGGVHLYN